MENVRILKLPVVDLKCTVCLSRAEGLRRHFEGEDVLAAEKKIKYTTYITVQYL